MANDMALSRRAMIGMSSSSTVVNTNPGGYVLPVAASSASGAYWNVTSATGASLATAAMLLVLWGHPRMGAVTRVITPEVVYNAAPSHSRGDAALGTPLAPAIATSLAAAELDPSDLPSALRAQQAANSFFVTLARYRQPDDVSFDDTGMLSLRWISGNRGVMVMFSGTDTGAYAHRDSVTSFTETIKQFDLKGLPPNELKKLIRYI